MYYVPSSTAIPLFACAQLGAQRNELFAEMQELLRQQEEDVASCKAALATMSQKAEAAEAVASSAGM